MAPKRRNASPLRAVAIFLASIEYRVPAPVSSNGASCTINRRTDCTRFVENQTVRQSTNSFSNEIRGDAHAHIHGAHTRACIRSSEKLAADLEIPSNSMKRRVEKSNRLDVLFFSQSKQGFGTEIVFPLSFLSLLVAPTYVQVTCSKVRDEPSH